MSHMTRWFNKNLGMGCLRLVGFFQIVGLFCKQALWKRQYSAKETYHFKEPTNRSHPIWSALWLTLNGLLSLPLCTWHIHVCDVFVLRCVWHKSFVFEALNRPWQGLIAPKPPPRTRVDQRNEWGRRAHRWGKGEGLYRKMTPPRRGLNPVFKLLNMRDTTHSHLWHDSCVAWAISMCVTSLIHMCDIILS